MLGGVFEERKVSVVLRQGFDGEVVGVEHESVLDCVHGSRHDRQAGAQYPGSVQSLGGLCLVSGRGHYVTVLVELAECVASASDVAGTQWASQVYRALAHSSCVLDLQR